MKLLLLTLLLAGCASMPATSPPSSFTGWKSTVMVSFAKVIDGGVESSTGTGTIISDNCVLTADHVVLEGADPVLMLNDGTFVKGEVSKEDAHLDLALICAPTPLGPVAQQATGIIDESIYVPGYPLGQRSLTEGHYEGSIVTAAYAPGNSGGGVFNSSGQLVGVVDAIAATLVDSLPTVFPNICMIIGMDDVASFLGDGHGAEAT